MPHPSEHQQLLHELDTATQVIQAIQLHEQEQELDDLVDTSDDGSSDILPGFIVITPPSPVCSL
ncbi:hypothetical protein PAXRUDRAFT_19972 [Paxillus rubicundulus Ve08.2h10]|uniref:Uncharacterized protein n=1 Tax=Paxillus rubicundulus Ve08.2h10 TaxID=930991 RepID=A0A0D0DAW7_9AGAM|nr:hypothetical protein PAXRUDRAFT_19972 [Paxillus rubicundulus Ve08.2h10]